MAMATSSSLAAAYSQAIVESARTCKIQPLLTETVPLSPGGLHVHNVMIIVTAIATGLCCVIIAILVLQHLRAWANPLEQRQLVRVMLALPVFALCSLLSVIFYKAAAYLDPVSLFYEPFAIVALFYFFVTTVTPSADLRDQFYADLERHHFASANGTPKHGRGSLAWFHLHWFLVFQLLLGRIGSLIAYEYVVARHCLFTPQRRHRTLAIRCVETVQVSIAIIAVVSYERRMKDHLSARSGTRALAKLWTFKTLVILQAAQGLVFQALTSSLVLKPTRHVSILDLQIGVPNMLVALEMMIGAVAFWSWAYTAKPYKAAARDGASRKKGSWSAVRDVADIRDILRGLVFAIRGLAPENFGKRAVHDGRMEAMAQNGVNVKGEDGHDE